MQIGQRTLVLEAVLLGIIGGVSAILFSWLVDVATALMLQGMAGYTLPGLASEGHTLQEVLGTHGRWWLPLTTTLGGLLSGIIVYTWAPEAEGHGTDTAVRAFHRTAGVIRARVPFLKTIASAITIGSGGSAGREGPTALIAGGVGSILATLTRRSDAERRLMVLMGMAAGLSAIFRSPIGTAVFAVEVLYGTMEIEAAPLLYTMLASLVAYVLASSFTGAQSLFELPAIPPAPLTVHSFGEFLLLGLLAGALASLVPTVFYGIRDLFHRIPVPPHVKPAIGGLLVGLLGMELPQILGGGYGYMEMALLGLIPLSLLAILCVAKLLALSLTVSSGGSGGVFAPCLYVGLMLGAALAVALGHPPAGMGVVGMASVFAGAARVPLATLLMVVEMTGGYLLLPHAALAVFTSYVLQSFICRRLGARYPSLYEAQVPTRADSPVHARSIVGDALQLIEDRHYKAAVGQRVDLESLVRSGLPVELPGHERLTLLDVEADSPWLGRDPYDLEPSGARPLMVMRGDGWLHNRDASPLQVGDRILLAQRDGT